MTTPVSIEEATMCFACGPDNSIGLQIRFLLKDGVCRGIFRPDENHVGYQDTVHGGIIFAALDDAMANVLYLQNIKAHTARCEIRYRRALAVGEEIEVSGWIDSQRKRLIVLKGGARLADNTLVADCEASFMTAQS
ncbi:MAG: PaaI family thioesterase [Woeseiaceae bacterium]